ncbi:hypothetical protein BJ878DRAFT_570525 [Calycina marina]|uniref:Uncharacterized protein n=1 Tax=Calycina marina TaxID=1763456 RepID=A0A9P8CBL6_9HELO|nr:hypothetical protein BJ878DRAFT_570525 [Calycina marina]
MANAKPNDITILELTGFLCREYGLKYDSVHHRVRSQRHIISLAAVQSLFVTDEEMILDSKNPVGAYKLEIKEFIETWAQKDLADDALTETEWETIAKIECFLRRYNGL